MAYRHGITIQNLKNRNKPFLVRWKGEFNFQTGLYKKPGKTFTRKKDAVLFADNIQDELDRGLDPQNSVTVGQFLDKYLLIRKNNSKHKTYILYENAIKAFQRYFNPLVPLKMINQEKCEEFLNQVHYIDANYKKRGGKISESTKHQYLRILKTTFKKAVKWDYLAKNPFSDISYGTPSRKAWYYIQPNDFKAIMDVLDKLPVYQNNILFYTVRKIRLKAFYSIMYGCGLRFGEAVNILWDDQNLDFNNNVVHIVNRDGSKNMPGFAIKDYESRSVIMPKFVVQALKELKQADAKSSPFVFLDKGQWKRVQGRWHLFNEENRQEQWDSKELMGSALDTFKRYCVKAGITTNKKLNLHSLRKGYGSNMQKICSPQTLKELMGHSSIVTTMEYYVQDTDENKRKAIEGLDRMME